jgi:hypothetical protein
MPKERISDDDTHPDMTKRLRAVHGPRPIAAVVPVVTRNAFNRAAPGVAQLMEAWPGVVGPALAEVTMPRRLSQGSLTIGCSGPVAMELQHLSTELLGRINQYLGSQAVLRLRFVQIGGVPASARPRSRTMESVEAAAAESVAHLAEGPLRTALAALGRAVLSESASRLGQQPHTKR